MEEEHYDFEHGTTDAFNLYAENILLFEIEVEKYTGGRSLYVTDSIIGEIHLREVITMYLTDKVSEILPNWHDIKNKFRTACGKIPFDDFPTKFPIYENKLKTIAKLKYCTNILKNVNNTDSYVLDTANYLLAIYYKLTGLACGQKHSNPCVKPKVTDKLERENKLYDNPIFKYLMWASCESFSSHVNYRELYDTPINKLVDNLFEYIVKTQYEFSRTVIEPWVGIDENGNYEQINDEIFVLSDTGVNSYTEAQEYAENSFNEWLIEEMHILDNGMRF